MKKNILLMIVLSIVVCSCGANDDNYNQINKISLSDSIVVMNVNNDAYISIIGADISDCKISSDNEFVAYTNYSNGKIDIYGDHVGSATIKVTSGTNTCTCKVKVNHLTNFIGSTVTSFGVDRKTLFALIRGNGLSGTYNTSEPNIIETSESFSFGYIHTYYYMKNDMLYAIKKDIKPNENDVSTSSNIITSMWEEFKYQTAYSETLTNIYPTNYVDATIFAQPSKCYAVYEQIKYGTVYGSSYQPETTNCIYMSKDLDVAKKHAFINSNY